MTQFFTSVRSISLLNLASGLIGWVETKANDIYEWVQSKVAALFDLASQGLHKLGKFLQPVYDALVKIGQILGNILGYLPDFLLGPLWTLLPKCIKDPIKEFFLTQILGRLPFFQKLQKIEGVWERLKAAAITILKQVFVDGNLRGAIWTFFSTMLDILGLPPQLVTRVIAKGAQALGDILNDPLGFLGNFLQAMKLGLEGFFNNIGTHLLGGLQAWLFSQFEGTGIEMPQDISFKSMLKLVFQVLGITVDMLIEILEEVTGKKGLKAKAQEVIGAISNAWDWFQKLITESKEGESFWDRLSNAVGSIWDFILDGVVGWLEQTIVKRALAWIAKKLDPTGVMAVITTIIDVFALLEAIMSKAKEIFEMIERVLDRIGEIIKGLFSAAAEVLERALAAAIPVAMAILAAVVGLDGAVDAVKEEIEKLRKKIRDGIKRVMTSIKDWILRIVGGGKDDGKDTIAAALQEIDTEAEHELDEGEVKQDEAEAIKNKVNLDHPQVIEVSSVKDGGETWDFEYVQLAKKRSVAKKKIPPTEIKKCGEGDKCVVADPLTEKDLNGTGPVDPPGWAHAQDLNQINDIWVRGHIVSEKLGGPGEVWNIVPLLKTVNGKMSAGPEADAKKAIASHKIMYYKAFVDLHSGGALLQDFPKQVTVIWWEKKGNDKINEQKVQFPHPPPPLTAEGVTFNLNEVGRPTLVKQFGLSEVFAKDVLYIRDKYAAGGFRGIEGLMSKMTAYYTGKLEPGTTFTPERLNNFYANVGALADRISADKRLTIKR